MTFIVIIRLNLKILSKLQSMMERLEESKSMEAAERVKLEEEIRTKQEEVMRIQNEVEQKDEETRRLQVMWFYLCYYTVNMLSLEYLRIGHLVSKNCYATHFIFPSCKLHKHTFPTFSVR